MTAIDDGQRREKRRAAASLIFGTLFALAGVLLYVLWDLPKAWEIILPMRLSTAGAFLVAAAAVGCATVVFHTLTHNDILTPSLLGFDALYVLINTLLVYIVGTQALLQTDNLLFFFIDIAVMIAFAVANFAPLLLRPSVGVEVLLLIGVTVLGVRYRRSVSLIMLSSEARLPLRRTGSTHWIPATGCWLTAV